MKLTATLALGLFVAGCDQAYAYDYGTAPIVQENVTPVASQNPLTTADGMTLYTFDNDVANISNCYDNCAINWPPYLVVSGTQIEGLTAIARDDGTTQWAKDGAPLYLWVGDTAPGETTGDGVGGVWHIAR